MIVMKVVLKVPAYGIRTEQYGGSEKRRVSSTQHIEQSCLLSKRRYEIAIRFRWWFCPGVDMLLREERDKCVRQLDLAPFDTLIWPHLASFRLPWQAPLLVPFLI